jgi:hypothetical protein
MRVNLIHSKLVFFKLVNSVNLIQREQWLLKKLTLKKKICSCEQHIHSWTVCVSHVETRKKAVFYCFQQIVVLPHINGGTHVFWLFNIL